MKLTMQQQKLIDRLKEEIEEMKAWEGMGRHCILSY